MIRRARRKVALCALLLAPAVGLGAGIFQPALAQTLMRPGSQPVEITADGAIRWDRPASTITADGGTQVVQGTLTLTAPRLTATYTEGPASNGGSGGIEVKTVVAEGGVRIVDGDRVAAGDTATYDVATGLMTLTGGALSVTSAQGKVTARDKITYNSTSRIATADGNATVSQQDRVLAADHITAHFDAAPAAGAKAGSAPAKAGTSAAGTGSLSSADAVGNVQVTTATETATGARGHYDAIADTARLEGGVRIVRGRTILTGEAATVDMKSGVSTLLAPKGQGDDKKARILFYPGDKNGAGDSKKP
ncbi:LptA/OstA family protein [Radicibacter daui]|uniref:LptA/OstA family protein n=1 Tax=Radicibacter daui TaxID=3064829 RepID=UPI004046EFFD